MDLVALTNTESTSEISIHALHCNIPCSVIVRLLAHKFLPLNSAIANDKTYIWSCVNGSLLLICRSPQNLKLPLRMTTVIIIVDYWKEAKVCRNPLKEVRMAQTISTLQPKERKKRHTSL